ncbi:MAG: hypothetical protein ACREFT_19020, partial [Acetobacteraceae bacterium]
FDPENVQKELAVYRPNGAQICAAQLIEAFGFRDYAAARRHMQARNAWLKAGKARLDAERKMSIQDLAGLYAKIEPEEAEAPEATVIAPLFRVPGKAPEIKNFDELLRKGREKLRAAANSDLEE